MSNVTIPSLWFLPIHNGRIGLSRQASAETNFNYPAPPFNQIKTLAETWPAATRVLSRGMREDPGNEVDNLKQETNEERVKVSKETVVLCRWG